MQIWEPSVYHIIYWSGHINETRMRLDSVEKQLISDPLSFHSAIAPSKQWNRVYCCVESGSFAVSEFEYSKTEDELKWVLLGQLDRYENDGKEPLLQLKLDQNDRMLLGTTGRGFVIWDFDKESPIRRGATYLALPHGVRNITTKMMTSNSVMVSSKLDYAVAGVRKNLYVWCLEARQLLKVLDAHFGRIIQLEALTIGNWNSVITSSIDRSVKVWNINNIFEQVHIIDRHEMQIDYIR